MNTRSSLRIGPALAGILTQVSPNASAAIKALAFLGAASAGLSLVGAHDEIAALLSSRLAPAVRQRLLALLHEDTVIPVSDSGMTAVRHDPEIEAVDLFAIGMEV